MMVQGIKDGDGGQHSDEPRIGHRKRGLSPLILPGLRVFKNKKSWPWRGGDGSEEAARDLETRLTSQDTEGLALDSTDKRMRRECFDRCMYTCALRR